jgi:hypothetical protein
MAGFKTKNPRLGWTQSSTNLNSEHGKVWRNVRADELEAGDIVANYGAVIYTQVTCRDEINLELGYPETKEYTFPKDTIFFAFVKKG